MKLSILRALVVTFSVAAFSLLSLSSHGADSGSSGSSDPMGGCCGGQSGSSSTPPPPRLTCGPGTIQRGDQCVGTKSK